MYDWPSVNLLRIRTDIDCLRTSTYYRQEISRKVPRMHPRSSKIHSIKDLLVGCWGKFNEKRCLSLASEIGFWSFYSVFPFITFIVAISSFFPFAGNPEKVLMAASRLLPFSVEDIVGPLVKRILGQPDYLLAAATLLLAMWSASRVVSSLIMALSDIYEAPETRPLWKRKAIALLLIAILTVIYLFAFLFLVVGPMVIRNVTEQMGLAAGNWFLVKVLRLAVVELAMLLAFMMVYRIAPNNWEKGTVILPGALFASLGWTGLSWAFSFYIANIAHIDRIYGTLGVVIIMLTWFYLIGLLILIGGIINSELVRMSRQSRAIQ
jgi:membrane protein